MIMLFSSTVDTLTFIDTTAISEESSSGMYLILILGVIFVIWLCRFIKRTSELSRDLEQECRYRPYFSIKGMHYTGEYNPGWYIAKLQIKQNEYDDFAIAVFANKTHVGWIPRENKLLHEEMSKGLKINGAIEIFKPTRFKGQKVQSGRFYIYEEHLPDNLSYKDFNNINDMVNHCTWVNGTAFYADNKSYTPKRHRNAKGELIPNRHLIQE